MNTCTDSGHNMVVYNNRLVLSAQNPCTGSEPYIGASIWAMDPVGFTITGKATREDNGLGSPVEGLDIRLEQDGQAQVTVTTDATGQYTFTNVPPGTYKLNPSQYVYSVIPGLPTLTVADADVAGPTFWAQPRILWLLSPADQAKLPSLGPVTFDWGNAAGANRYQIRIGKNAALTTALVKNIFVTPSQFTLPSGLAYNTTYYWAVSAFTGTVRLGDSLVYSFTTPNPPPLPVLLTPVSGVKLNTITPTFTWKAPDTTPHHYRLQISQSNTFRSLDFDETTATSTPQWSFPSGAKLLPNRVYFWRVSAVSASGDASAWTAFRSFTILPLAPVLGYPNNGTTANNLRPELGWGPVDNTGGYQVQIYRETGTTSALVLSATAKTATYIPTITLQANAHYGWKVRANGKGSPGAWSSVSSFTTPQPPAAPTLSSLAVNRQNNQLQPIFSWTASAGTNHYRVQVSSNASFPADASMLIDATTSASTFPTPDSIFLKYNGKYYWRVMSCNNLDQCSLWTTTSSFFTLPRGPIPAVLWEGDTTPSVVVTLGWSIPTYDYQSLPTFTVQLSLDNFKTVYKSINATMLRTTVTLPPAKTFSWRVIEKGLGGSVTGVMVPFTTPAAPKPPSVPTPLHPAAGEVVKDFTFADFSWAPSTGSPTVYQFQVSDYPDYRTSSPKTRSVSVMVSSDLQDPLHPHYGIGLEAGVLYWHVRAGTANDEWSNWCITRKFSTYSGLHLLVINAETAGDPIPYVTVKLNDIDTGITTDLDGELILPNVKNGTLKLTLSAEGFAERTVLLNVPLGSNLVLWKVGLVPLPSDGQYRIILYANPQPPDRELALNLWLPAASPDHLSPDNPGKVGSFPDAALQSQAPITQWITMAGSTSGQYRFAINQKSASPAAPLAGAKLEVAVYRGSNRLGRYMPPVSGSGSWWYVFDLDGDSGALTTRNLLRATVPTPYADSYITGKVVQENGHPLAGVVIDYGEGQVSTNVDGSYAILGVTAKELTLTPSKTGYSFDPIDVPVTAPAQGVNFIAMYQNTYAGLSSALAVQGDLAYLGVGSHLEVVNVANKANLTLVKKIGISAEGTINQIRLAGDYAYLAQGSDGLNILSLADPANPVWLSNIPMSNCVDLMVKGKYAYAFDLGSGLWVIDISDPVNPRVVTKMASPLTGTLDAAALAISGSYLYVGITDFIQGDHVEGLMAVYSLADPQRPVLVKSFSSPNIWFDELVVRDSTLFVGREAWEHTYYSTGLITIYDISSPTVLKEITQLGGGDQHSRVVLSGPYAFIGAGSYGMVIYDISNLNNPVERGTVGSNYSLIGAVAAQDTAHVYFIDEMQLTAVDVHNPDNLWPWGRISPRSKRVHHL
jgi:hypothetical protein